MDDPEGWRTEPLAGGGPDREPPRWLRLARSLAESRGVRALGAAVTCAVVAGLAFRVLDVPDRPTEQERPTGPVAKLSPGVGRLWHGDTWYASDTLVPDLDGIPPTADPAARALAILGHAAPGARTASLFTLLALDAPIRVEGVRVDHLRCEAPVAGTLLVTHAGGAGTGEPVVGLTVDLDAPEPSATRLDSPGTPFPGLPLDAFQAHRFEVVFTSARHCRFLARLVVSSRGRTSALDLSSETRPEAAAPIGFEVTGPAARYENAYAVVGEGEKARIARRDPRTITVADGDLVLPAP
ncbi:hypothetical protein EDD29_5805 [Actinocorallia herbida]|uniref:Uncharacterized protein n=1 Tax=Actinocorallia herbida TaxID=58109 RepID=A0A3N1D3P3_9ACTN|nr:hypothetical protein [Actinocorallia herbida]ROO88145.1 hypothetical protein EDD29_5805 [Actinocorallia herbida]